jgi:20S proteasome alpha/beta subunit
MNPSISWPKPKRKTIVTLIVGIICKDAIVLAADSQTTRGFAKQLGTNKINTVEFQNGKVLVAESGSASLSTAAIEIFQRKARGIKIESDSTVGDLAKESVREVVKGITEHLGTVSSDTERQTFLFQEVNYFELMIAYYFEGKPHLEKLNPAWCIPVRATSYFATSGIAGDLANYILLKHTTPEMDCKLAFVIGIKVLLDAINNVEGCGHPIKVALIFPPASIGGLDLYPSGDVYGNVYSGNPTRELTRETVDEITEIIGRVEQQTQTNQIKKFHSILLKKSNKAMAEVVKRIEVAHANMRLQKEQTKKK